VLWLQRGEAVRPRASRAEEKEEEPDEARRAFVAARRDVLELGASTFEGRAKRVWEGKALASAGAVVKEAKHKMPLRMRLGVQSKQRHLERRRLEKERESGVIHGKSASTMTVHGKRANKASKMVSRKRSERKLGGVRSLDDDRWHGGVLRVSPGNKNRKSKQ
jgi:hypothetical protein